MLEPSDVLLKKTKAHEVKVLELPGYIQARGEVRLIFEDTIDIATSTS